MTNHISKYERSLTNYMSVKTSLMSIIKDKSKICAINSAVLTTSKLVTHTYNMLKLYCLDVYDKTKHLPLIDTTLIKSIIKTIGVKDKRGKKSSSEKTKLLTELKKFYEKEYKETMINEQPLSFTHLNTILDYESISVITSIENHIKEHYIDCLFRYINVCIDKKNMEMSIKEELESDNILRKIILDNYRKKIKHFKSDIVNRTNKYNIKMFDTLKHYILNNIYPSQLTDEPLQQQIDENPYSFLESMIKMSREIESKNQKTFNCFPLRKSCIPKYIKLDTTSIIHILFSDNMNKGYYLTKNNTKIYQDKIWSMFFRTERKMFKSKTHTFNNSIITDGFACSILLIRKDLYNPFGRNKPKSYSKPFNYKSDLYIDELTETEKNKLKQMTLIGIDPGKEDLIYATNGKQDNTGKNITYRYSQNQRRHETKKKKYAKIINKDRKTIKINDKTVEIIESELSQFDSKTCNYKLFKQYVSMKNNINTIVSSYYEKDIFRKLKWYTYINKQKSESWMLNSFKKKFNISPSNTVICIGDFSQKHSMQYKEPTKGKSIRKLFKKAGYKLYLVNEYNTSKKSFINGQNTEKFRMRTNPRPWKQNEIKQVHGLLRAINVTGNNNPGYVLLNRDLNGSMNILKKAQCIINNIPIPKYLCRNSE